MILHLVTPLLFFVSSGGEAVVDSQSLTVYADVVYTSTGERIENGGVTVSDGRIRAVGAMRAPKDALHVAAITAGMIDLSGHVTTGGSVEESREVTPEIRVAGTLDPFSISWARQLRSGVTTVLVSPDDRNVIGGLAVALKTGGEKSIEARTVKADAALRGAFGSEPSRGNHPAYGRPTDFYSRRPTTRMGVEWEWRKAMYDAVAASKDPARTFPGSDELMRALKGELVVVAQAWATQDIRTAIFLVEEMAQQVEGGVRLVLDAGAETWKEPDLLKRSKAAVILPPFAHAGRTTDGAFMAWNVARRLQDLGVTIALSSHDALDDGARLAMQGAYARRGGLTLDEALAAVTINPARMIGIDDRVGSIEIGKDGDLCLWSGEPFQATSRVVGVVLDGELVVDPRAAE